MSASPSNDSRRGPTNNEDLGLPQQTPLAASDTVIIVVYQLPLKIARLPGGGFDIKWATPSNSVSHTGMALPTRSYWVGCISLDGVTPQEETELERRLLEARETPFSPHVAPRFPHMSEINSSSSFFRSPSERSRRSRGSTRRASSTARSPPARSSSARSTRPSRRR